ncbi:MAG: cellulase family glycosylhydrolase [Gemmatimonadaceae bacterium]
MTFELGVNYWPRRSAMYTWREFDPGEVRDEMAQIASIGFDVVRIFALTQDFLPDPLAVDPKMIARLVEVVQIAMDAGLTVVPTLIVINMSGLIWWPSWMLDARGRPGNLFSDRAMLQSQVILAESCARALAGERAIRAFDLANEIDDAQRPASRVDGMGWASALASAIRRAAPMVPIRIGAHLPSLTHDNNMRVDDLASVVDEDVMHAYPLYSDLARSFLDPQLVPFSCALTAALSGRGKPALMQEFGLCTAPAGTPARTITDDFLGKPTPQYLATEEEQAAYYGDVLEGLVKTGAAGAYAWCYSDYDPSLYDRAPFATAVRERTFGLVRSDGSEKPAAGVFRRFRQTRDAAKLESGATHGPTIPNVLDVTADEYYRDPTAHFVRLYARWLSREDQVKGDAIVRRFS